MEESQQQQPEAPSPEVLLTMLREAATAILDELHPAGCSCGKSNEEVVAADRAEVSEQALNVGVDTGSADFWKGVAVSVTALINGAERITTALLARHPEALVDPSLMDLLRSKTLTAVLQHAAALAIGSATEVLEPLPPLNTIDPLGGAVEAA